MPYANVMVYIQNVFGLTQYTIRHDSEIIVTDTREELVQYPNQQWKHVVLYTVLNQTRFGYIPLHWHKALQFIYVIEGASVLELIKSPSPCLSGTLSSDIATSNAPSIT